MRTPWSSASIDADVVLRALGISMVVFNHAYAIENRPFELNGGMNALILLSGYSLARFSLNSETAAGFRRSVLNLATHVLLPCLALILLTFAARRTFVPSEFFFYQNWVSSEQYVPYYSWYPQALLQTLLILVLLFSLPGVLRGFRRRPFFWSLVATIGFLGLRLLQRRYWPLGEVSNHVPPAMLWQFAVGWVLYHATADEARFGVGRKIGLLIFLAGIVYLGLGWGHLWLRTVLTIAAIAFLLFVRRVTLPSPVRRAVLIVSQATFTIFLCHVILLAIAHKLGLRDHQEGFHFWDIFGIWAFMLGGSVAIWIGLASFGRAWRYMLSQRAPGAPAAAPLRTADALA